MLWYSRVFGVQFVAATVSSAVASFHNVSRPTERRQYSLRVRALYAAISSDLLAFTPGTDYSVERPRITMNSAVRRYPSVAETAVERRVRLYY